MKQIALKLRYKKYVFKNWWILPNIFITLKPKNIYDPYRFLNYHQNINIINSTIILISFLLSYLIYDYFILLSHFLLKLILSPTQMNHHSYHSIHYFSSFIHYLFQSLNLQSLALSLSISLIIHNFKESIVQVQVQSIVLQYLFVILLLIFIYNSRILSSLICENLINS